MQKRATSIGGITFSDAAAGESSREAADMASVLISQHNQLCRTDRIDLRSRFVLVASGKREVCYQGGSLLWPGTSRSWNTSRGLSVLVCEIVDAGKG